MEAERYINWFEHSSRSIGSRYPQARGCADYITERLAALLFECLPRDVSMKMISMLPPSLGEHSWPLHVGTRGATHRRIGYMDFIERTRMALVCAETNFPTTELKELAQGVSDVFLWTICQELPAEMKGRVSASIPEGLRSRMDLFCAASDESRVA